MVLFLEVLEEIEFENQLVEPSFANVNILLHYNYMVVDY